MVDPPHEKSVSQLFIPIELMGRDAGGGRPNFLL